MSMDNFANYYSHFVSLGDNCEFGFAQRHYGVEAGALLKWAITPPDALLRCLKSRFENMYHLENLVPFASDMVLDKGTGLSFHSEMRSIELDGQLVFERQIEERRAIYLNEIEKINYMRDKLLSQFEGGNQIFVYKKNSGLNLKFYAELSLALLSYHPENILLIVEADAESVPGLMKLSSSLYIGTIQALAPYENANLINQEQWDFLVSQLAKTCMLDDARSLGEGEKINLIGRQATDWSKGIAHELWFWSRWFETKGLEWTADFEARLSGSQALVPALKQLIPAGAARKIRILDVGAGPMTNIGFTDDSISLDIQACDPLADFYSKLAEKYQVHRPIETQFAVAEDLGSYFAESSFDIVNCCNALDHSADPIRGIVEMLKVVKNGGAVYLKHHINEAETENYEGFHQFNFDLKGGRFIVWNKQEFTDVGTVVPIKVEISAYLEEPDIIVVIRKLEEFRGAAKLQQVKSRIRHIQRAFIGHQIKIAANELKLDSPEVG